LRDNTITWAISVECQTRPITWNVSSCGVGHYSIAYAAGLLALLIKALGWPGILSLYRVLIE